jgi:hypothetical protein
MSSEAEQIIAEIERKAYNRTKMIGGSLVVTVFAFLFAIVSVVLHARGLTIAGGLLSALAGMTTLSLMSYDEKRSIVDTIKIRSYIR